MNPRCRLQDSLVSSSPGRLNRRERLEVLAKISGTQKIIPSVFEFVDIAGLVKGASQGEGRRLGQYSAHEDAAALGGDPDDAEA